MIIPEIEKMVSDRMKANDTWWTESEKQVLDRYQPIFKPDNIQKLTKEDFKSFLLAKNNRHWTSIHRQGNIVTEDMDALRRYLAYVLTEDQLIEERLNTAFNKFGGYWIKGIGRATITPILLIVYPHKYGIWNLKSEKALKELGIFPQVKSGEKFGDQYKKINKVLLDIAQSHKISLWQLDGLLGDFVGASPLTNEL